MPWSCSDCGVVTNHRHLRCDECIDADPRQTPELRGRRGAAIAARKRSQQEWTEVNPEGSVERDYFRQEILPGLAKVKLADIMVVTGFSKAFASQVRSGKFTPHESTWSDLHRLIGATCPARGVAKAEVEEDEGPRR